MASRASSLIHCKRMNRSPSSFRKYLVTRNKPFVSDFEKRYLASEPFYGSPRPDDPIDDFATSCGTSVSRVALLMKNAMTALNDPTRADAVAAVGELTGLSALQELRRVMESDPQGRILLQDKPVVSKETIPYEKLIEESSQSHILPPSQVTFGHAYGNFLASHGFDPDERDPIQYIEDPDLAYVMLRYRQCHDFWHALTALPPTVAGELGLKWLELFQTGLPLPALSSTIGSLRLDRYNQGVVWGIYLPWAHKLSQSMKFGRIMTVYYEREFDTPLDDLRQRLGIHPAPQNVERPHSP